MGSDAAELVHALENNVCSQNERFERMRKAQELEAQTQNTQASGAQQTLVPPTAQIPSTNWIKIPQTVFMAYGNYLKQILPAPLEEQYLQKPAKILDILLTTAQTSRIIKKGYLFSYLKVLKARKSEENEEQRLTQIRQYITLEDEGYFGLKALRRKSGTSVGSDGSFSLSSSSDSTTGSSTSSGNFSEESSEYFVEEEPDGTITVTRRAWA